MCWFSTILYSPHSCHSISWLIIYRRNFCGLWWHIHWTFAKDCMNIGIYMWFYVMMKCEICYILAFQHQLSFLNALKLKQHWKWALWPQKRQKHICEVLPMMLWLALKHIFRGDSWRPYWIYVNCALGVYCRHQITLYKWHNVAIYFCIG